jgi:hypothetical protein
VHFKLACLNLVGVLALAGCQHSGAARCPHCHQVHATAEAPASALPSASVSPANYANLNEPPAPLPHAPIAAAPVFLAPVPPVPGVEE